MLDLIFGLVLIAIAVIFAWLCIKDIIQLRRIFSYKPTVDKKMLTAARILTWGPVIFFVAAVKQLHSSVFNISLTIVIMAIYVFGRRLYVMSFKNDDDKDLTELDNRVLGVYKRISQFR